MNDSTPNGENNPPTRSRVERRHMGHNIEFRIADTFLDSLARLTNEEQKISKLTVFDLQSNPKSPGFNYHKLEKVRDKNFRSLRVNDDIRIIIHTTPSSLLLCYIDHHDKAYSWAESRKLETHPKTGAAQFVEIREIIRERINPQPIPIPPAQPSKPSSKKPKKAFLFAHLTPDDLLGFGVPQEWIEEVRQANEDTILSIVEHLPGEAAEALLELATGGKPEPPVHYMGIPPALTEEERMVLPEAFRHPDAQRRFRVIENIEELERALDFPWEKWSIFLHPAQRRLVEQDYSGPVRISGSAGTGKTIVALHRAVYLARTNPDSRVLFTTFSKTLSNALHTRLIRLIGNKPRLKEQIEIYPINSLGKRLYELNFERTFIASADEIRELITQAAHEIPGHTFKLNFLESEWQDIFDARQPETWEEYRDVRRLGRKTRLSEHQRQILWNIFSRVSAGLKTAKKVTYAFMFRELAKLFGEKEYSPFDYVIIDESQDLSIPQLKFLASMGAQKPNFLFFTGDLGQRIFQQPFSWKALGVDIRGRSRKLHINYRTSHQIRMQADRLIDLEVSDVDGNTEDRSGTISVFNGPEPIIQVMPGETAEIKEVSQWIKKRIEEGIEPHEIGVFVRSFVQLERAQQAVTEACQEYKILDENVEPVDGYISVSTMHLAKGLEFRAVTVMACDDEVIPLQERIENVSDTSDLEEVCNTERHLLYVACTRARDYLLVTGVAPASEFLDDLRGE